jgi:hypothetical protein
MILGAAGEVHRSAERSRVLAALQDAAGPMTPKEIQSRRRAQLPYCNRYPAEQNGEGYRDRQDRTWSVLLTPGQTEQTERSDAENAATNPSGLSRGGGKRVAKGAL